MKKHRSGVAIAPTVSYLVNIIRSFNKKEVGEIRIHAIDITPTFVSRTLHSPTRLLRNVLRPQLSMEARDIKMRTATDLPR